MEILETLKKWNIDQLKHGKLKNTNIDKKCFPECPNEFLNKRLIKKKCFGQNA